MIYFPNLFRIIFKLSGMKEYKTNLKICKIDKGNEVTPTRYGK